MTNATSTFIPGPAAIAATRFHVGWRQYASGAVPSSTSLHRLLGGLERGRGQLRLIEAALSAGSAARAAS